MTSVIVLISATLLAAGLTFATNWLALIPWRRSKDRHWSEQARLVYPVLVGAHGNLLFVPGLLTLVVAVFWPGTSPLWLFAGIVSVLAAYLGSLPMDHEVFPRIPMSDLIRLAAISCMMRFLIWFVFLGAAVAMPDQFNEASMAIAGLVLWLWVVWVRGGMILLGQKCGLFQPASDRLSKIVAATSAKMNIPFRRLLLMRAPLAQALAFPNNGTLLFTERLMELLPDDEVAAVCSHELAHLTESRIQRFSRSIQLMTFLPWLFFNPLIHTFGSLAIFPLCGVTMLAPYTYKRISRKLETRADAFAKANEQDVGTYARALMRLHADNLIPAVAAKEGGTHPHLYDRILAAGITPDFARPQAAKSISWNGLIFAWIAGAFIAILAIRTAGG